MISYWQVIGRCCLDPDFYNEVNRIVHDKYPPPPRNRENMWKIHDSAVPEEIHNFLRDARYRISLFEVWEVVRFFSDDPKGPDSTTLVPDAIATIHELTPGLPITDRHVHEIIGVCCVDRKFTKAL